MKKYFYTDGTYKYGPFTLDELREKNISRETKVWFQELIEWKSAGDVTELAEIFKLVPPPLRKTNFSYSSSESLNNQKPPKTWLSESILVTFFCCLPFGIAGIINAAKVESRYYSGDIEGAYKSSADARKWTLASFWTGIIVIIIYFIIILASAAVG